MSYNFPSPIKGESDLQLYKKYIRDCALKPKTEKPTAEPAEETLKEMLKKLKGKSLRVDSICGGRLSSRFGTLCETGNDYITLKTANGRGKVICTLADVRYIYVLF